ncbi:CpaD family pilus assembly lipoprotein [Shumkonia mesophila]|uniref:CpaD family pilus assembly lipoprotein n=1 Tax=Shumkonia mesophila TaxID=2838854 RepID=UPI002934D1B8|nr:CpaD family pilus assembly lipoprotein [Shumkonia mesophila]
MTPRTPLFRPLLTALGVASALALTGGCEATFYEDWSAIPAAKEAKVAPVRYAHAIRFAPESARLEGLERDRLDEFLARVQAGPADTVLVTGAGGGPLAGRRLETVSAYLVHLAMRPRTAGEGAQAAGPDAVSVAVERYTVTLPACPDWSDRPGRSWNNTVSRNWGCATATNLGLMVAEPGDLATGRDPGPTDGAFATLAIQRYRAGKTRPLDSEGGGSSETSGSGGGTTGGGAGQ